MSEIIKSVQIVATCGFVFFSGIQYGKVLVMENHLNLVNTLIQNRVK